MATTAEHVGPARADAARRMSPGGRVLRGIVSAHVVAIFGQPVFAGIYLSGNFDGLLWHQVGADIVTSLGYLQLIAAIVVWVRLRLAWPCLSTLTLVAAETVQYFAGMDGALWLHLPLGVMTIVGIVVQFIAVWIRPIGPTISTGPATPTTSEEGDSE
ncbi:MULTISPECIES: hypothetical protein [unclassified Streptomyces]|uniref:hypothetical protein n=1 Tax=unclassified Streptomyces TaxID=2593676 RepID=UPI0023658554|nr:MULTISPECIES: hypothetical protein [unclassified Streptomyces]MDF3148117.1 hypothetical protein [Streptomyces sp. T21Q-yed]WDF40212.1 hypothetical protein PBV52_27210 [Streptomyces sp. T12]